MFSHTTCSRTYGIQDTPSRSRWSATRLYILFTLLLAFTPRISAQTNLFDDDWRWTTFTTENGLPANNVTSIIETPAGTPWAVTSAGVAWFNGYEWVAMDSSKGLPSSVSRIDLMPGTGDSLYALIDYKLYSGSRLGFRLETTREVNGAVLLDNNLLVTSNASLFTVYQGRLIPFTVDEHLTAGKSLNLMQTQSGGVWLNSTAGLLRWQGGHWKVRLPSSETRFQVNCLAEDSSGTGILSLALPVEERGLWEWTSHGTLRRSSSEVGDYIRSADIAPDGTILTLHFSGDIRLRVKEQWSALTTRPSFLRNLSKVHFRRDGDVWLASEHGILLYRQSSRRWTYDRYLTPDPRNRIHEILIARNGDMWIATADGIAVRNTDGVTRSIPSIGNERLFEATGLAEDSIGGIWVSGGFAYNGAYRWDGKSWEYFRIDTLKDSFRIHKIRADRKGHLWFLGIAAWDDPSGSVEPGAYQLDHGKFIRWDAAKGMNNGRVYSFAEGPDGAYWFGTGIGMSRWKSGSWKHWTKQSGLLTSRIFTIAIDNEGTAWFGDRKTGLGYITVDDSVHYLTTADGLVDNRIWDLGFDPSGKLWIATEDGLGSYYRGNWAAFGARSGLENPVLWPVHPMADKVMVGTLGSGVAILSLQENSFPPPRITLSVPITESGTALLRWQPNSYWGIIPQKDILTRYRIDDRPWSAWGVLREVVVNDLSTGSHKIQVQAKGLFGSYDSYGRELTFSTAVPFYKNAIFIGTLGTLLLAVAALGLILLRRRQQHDAEIRESEAKFRAVTETTSSAILIYQEGHFLYLNQGAEFLTGYPRSELFRMYFSEIVHPDYHEVTREHGFIGDDGMPMAHRWEFPLRTKSGEYRWVDYTAAIIVYQGRPAVLGTAFDITERKRAEEALRRQELEYRMLLDHVPAMIWFKDGNNRILRLNKTAAESSGKTVQELEGVSTYDLYPPEHAEQYHLDDLEVINSGQPKFGIVEPYSLPSGETRWIQTDKIPYRGADGRIIGVIVFSQDITDRKRTELMQSAVYGIEQAAATTIRLEDLFVAVHAILSDVMQARNFYIALYDDRDDILMFPYFKDEFDPPPTPRRPGHGLTEYVLRTGKSLLCDSDSQVRLTMSGEADIVGAPSPIWLGVPLIVDRKTIGVMTVQHYSDPKAFGEQERQIMEFVSSQIAKAIQRKTAEDALRDSEERYRTLFEESEDTVFISSPDGHLIDINPAGLRLFGFDTREELLRKDIAHDLYFHPEERQNILSKLIEEGSIQEVELHVRRKDGSIRTVLETAKVVHDSSGAIVAFRGILRDITERKLLEQQLMQAQKLESIGTLAGGIAHDFNNILTIILGYASIIERRALDQAAFEKNIAAIKGASHRGANLVRQLLTFARKADVLSVPTNLNAQVTDLVKLLEATFPKMIVFKLDLALLAPQIVGDPNQIHQAILNLCVNARDAMPAGGALTLRTRIVRGESLRPKYADATDSDYIAVDVEDSGIGMNEQTQSRIFEPFFTTKEIGKGTGLGLALVYGVMQSHQGFVDVRSAPGHGTTFTLFFPVPAPHTTDQPARTGKSAEERKPA